MSVRPADLLIDPRPGSRKAVVTRGGGYSRLQERPREDRRAIDLQLATPQPDRGRRSGSDGNDLARDRLPRVAPPAA